MRARKVQSSKRKVQGRKAVDREKPKAGRPTHVSRFTFHVSRLLDWFAVNARDLPWRRTRYPYAIWVSEIMLQQTQVKTVIPYWERWMRELPTVASLASASPERIHKLWEGLGYYTRVRNMQKAARVIVETHGGKFPTRFDDVLALPGIGRYTAGAVCSIAFNQPTPILDGNVIRVLARVFGIRENVKEKDTNAQLWALAERLVHAAARERDENSPMGQCSALNQALMELGATICVPRHPRCAECPLSKCCAAHRLKIVEKLPNLGKRVPITARSFVACIIERDGAVLVRQRPAGVVNAHLWELPNAEVSMNISPSEKKRAVEAELGCEIFPLSPMLTLKHSITRYRITLEAFRGAVNGSLPRAAAGRWIPRPDLDRLPFTSAHRRVLHKLGIRDEIEAEN